MELVLVSRQQGQAAGAQILYSRALDTVLGNQSVEGLHELFIRLVIAGLQLFIDGLFGDACDVELKGTGSALELPSVLPVPGARRADEFGACLLEMDHFVIVDPVSIQSLVDEALVEANRTEHLGRTLHSCPAPDRPDQLRLEG